MLKWILFFFLGFLQFTFAETVRTFPVGVQPHSEVTKEDAEKLMQRLENLFGHDIKAGGLTLQWQWDWENPYIGAGSLPPKDSFTIVLWGGFVRAPQMTLPALALILCHELGHRLGGPPYMKNSQYQQISSEGQADFFAAQKCWPRLSQSSFFESNRSSDFSLKFCGDNLICASTLEAAQDFGQILHLYFGRLNPLARIENQAREQVTNTLDLAYPTEQCRIDTFKAGALCAKDSSQCKRPACWFVP